MPASLYTWAMRCTCAFSPSIMFTGCPVKDRTGASLHYLVQPLQFGPLVEHQLARAGVGQFHEGIDVELEGLCDRIFPFVTQKVCATVSGPHVYYRQYYRVWSPAVFSRGVNRIRCEKTGTINFHAAGYFVGQLARGQPLIRFERSQSRSHVAASDIGVDLPEVVVYRVD